MSLLWASLLFGALSVAWLTNVVGLPGNWIALACAIGYWVWGPAESPLSISVATLVVMAALAVIGELLELVAGSAGVAKAGGSRRSALYAIVGSIAGALVGLVLGVPIPVVGPLVGSLLFASLGAMAGAMYGERGVGRGWRESLQTGKAAFVGRALGTLTKMIAGLAMIVVALVAMLF